MSIIDKFKDLLEAIKTNADTTRCDRGRGVQPHGALVHRVHRALPLLTDALMHVGMF